MDLTQFTKSGNLIRLTHEVYKYSGAPSTEYDELRSAWLTSDLARLAWDRHQGKPGKVTVSGESAAALHHIGKFRAMRSEFTTPTRKQTQRSDVYDRIRVLSSEDITIQDGLPVTTPERTIAHLVEKRAQLDRVGDALRDTARNSQFEIDRVVELLESAHIDLESFSKQILKMHDLSVLVARDYLAKFDTSKFFDSAARRSALESLKEHLAAPPLTP